MSSEDTHTLRTRLAAVEAERDALKLKLRDQAMDQLGSDAGWELENDKLRADLSAALARAVRAEKAIQDYLDGNYDNPRARRPGKCRHEIWYWETCENCIDEHFTAALSPVAEEA